MGDKDKISKKNVLVVLVFVCALIYLLLKNHVCAREETQEINLELIQEARIAQEKERIVQEEAQKRVQEAQEKERIVQEETRKKTRELIQELAPKVTSKSLLDKIREEHRRLTPINKNTSYSLAEIQLSGHETERYIEQYTIERINGDEDVIGTLKSDICQSLLENVNSHQLLFDFLDIMRTFNFLELIKKNNKFNFKIAKNYVGNFLKICNILCDDGYYIDVYSTIQIRFINVNLAIELVNLRRILKRIYKKKYFYFGYILENVSKYCCIFFNRIPKLRNWDKNNKALKEEFTMVEIKYSSDDVRFYCVGGMNSAVIHWQSMLETSFEPERVCRIFNSLVVLGELHLDNPYVNEFEIDKIIDIQKSLDYARIFVEIYDSMQENLTVHERAELILSELETKAQMKVPQMDVDLFRLPYRESMQYYFRLLPTLSPLRLAIGNVLPHYDWRGSANSFQLHFMVCSSTISGCFPFDINKFKKHIADLSKFIIASQEVRPKDDDKVLAATKAILGVNEILTTAFGKDPTKLANMISELKPLEYKQYKQSEIDEIFRNNDTIIANENKIIKMIISILEPLRALDVALPIWKEKKCIVLYKDGITGDIYYRFYSVSDGELIEAIDIIQPGLNWINAQGDFDVNALNEQVQQIHALAINVKYLKGKNLTNDVVCIGYVFEQLYNLLGYKDWFPTDEIYQGIMRILSESNNSRLRMLAREIFPPPLADVRDKKKLRKVNKESDHRTQWNKSNKLPFYSKLYREYVTNYLQPNEGVFSLAYSTAITWKRASHEVPSYNHFTGMHFEQTRPWSPYTVILWERAFDEVPSYSDFIKCTTPGNYKLKQ